MALTPVTFGQWWAVTEPQSELGPRPLHPYQAVLWGEAGKFARQLGQITGGSFRLPSEAEWEYACRAGSSGPVYLGDAEGALDGAAWSMQNSRGRTHAVMKKAPNAWGLFDVLGNVWEWCSDGQRAYTAEDVTDPLGPNGPRRIVKGGCWASSPGRCRAGARYAEEARRRAEDQGFRVVMDWA
jgi:formylglycine-generating enzyme required for sulfatase activity